MKKSRSKSRKRTVEPAAWQVGDKVEDQFKVNGDYLRTEREKLGYTQEELASQFGVTINTYSRWERDHFPPNAPGAIRLAIEYLKIKKMTDENALLLAIEQRKAELDAMSDQIVREREEFARSIKQ